MNRSCELSVGSAQEQDLLSALTILERLGIVDFNGHASIRLADGRILINSGSSVRSKLCTSDLVVCGIDGGFNLEQAKPPAELPLHLAVYRRRADVNAVIHCHPRWSTLLTSTATPYQVTFAQGALLGDVPVFDSPRSINNDQTASELAALLGEGVAALMKSHGSVVVGESIRQATVLAIYLEMNAERQVRGAALGEPYVFSADEAAACRRGLHKPALFEKCWNYYEYKFELSAR